MLIRAGVVAQTHTATSIPPFTPTDISGLKFWVKADSLALSDNDPVSSWTDSSGLGNHATQGTGGAQPTYKTNIQNGLPVIRFDGAGDWLEVSDTSIIGGNSGISVFIVFKQAVNNVTKALLTKWDYQTEGCFMATTYLGTIGQIEMFVANATNDAGGNNQYTTDIYPTDDYSVNFYTISIVYDGTQAAGDKIKFYLDGALKSSNTNGTVPASLTSANSTLKVGRAGGVIDWFFNGDIGEVVLYDSALSNPDRTAVEDYLTTKWGL